MFPCFARLRACFVRDDLPLLTKTQSIDMRQRQATENDSECIEENYAAVSKGWSEPMKRAKRSMTVALFVLTLAAGSVLADTVTPDGYYECSRGSKGGPTANGRDKVTVSSW